MCREKLVELAETLKSNGYSAKIKEVNDFVKESGFEGAYTFLIYYAKRIDSNFVKGHKLPEVTHSLVPCSRCNGQGSSSKWAHTGNYCYDCNGKGLVLKGQQTFRNYVKGYAENIEIKKLEDDAQEAQKERTFKVEYFKQTTREITGSHEFKVSELTDTSWKGVETFVTEKLGVALTAKSKAKTVREYRDFVSGKGLRIKF